MPQRSETLSRFLLSVSLLSAATLFLFGFRVLLSGSARYWFIPENLALSWISFLLAWLIHRGIKRRRWSSWQNLALTFLWLIFLPNAWYVLTDFVHIFPNGEVSQIYDIVLMSLLAVTGFSLGLASLFLIHAELLKRISILKSYLLVEVAILVSSFAVYLGRDLRWNSWDVIKNPEGVIINVSDRIIDPFGSPRALNVTLLFFIMVSTIYTAVWLFGRPYITPRR